jgi:hypothetical protein
LTVAPSVPDETNDAVAGRASYSSAYQHTYEHEMLAGSSLFHQVLDQWVYRPWGGSGYN